MRREGSAILPLPHRPTAHRARLVSKRVSSTCELTNDEPAVDAGAPTPNDHDRIEARHHQSTTARQADAASASRCRTRPGSRGRVSRRSSVRPSIDPAYGSYRFRLVRGREDRPDASRRCKLNCCEHAAGRRARCAAHVRATCRCAPTAGEGFSGLRRYSRRVHRAPEPRWHPRVRPVGAVGSSCDLAHGPTCRWCSSARRSRCRFVYVYDQRSDRITRDKKMLFVSAALHSPSWLTGLRRLRTPV